MKITIHSDFHFEHHPDSGRAIMNSLPDADVCVLAGDIANLERLPYALAYMCDKFEHVVYVIGNHELWGHSFKKLRDALQEISISCSNLHFLDNQIASINGVRFVGSTMFFRNSAMNVLNEAYLVDFSLVENYREEVYVENEKADQFLHGYVQPGDIVITHHMPSYRSVNEIFRRSALNDFFVCDMENLMALKRPSLWIHGHTHFAFDYRFMDTRVICNPLGYPGETRQWRANTVIDV